MNGVMTLPYGIKNSKAKRSIRSGGISCAPTERLRSEDALGNRFFSVLMLSGTNRNDTRKAEC